MESIQIAQVLADLSDLQNTDPKAAHALLSPSSQRPPLHKRTQTSPPSLALTPDVPSTTPSSPSASTIKFDRLGRRITGGSMRPTPPMSRANSMMSGLPTSPTNGGNRMTLGEKYTSGSNGSRSVSRGGSGTNSGVATPVGGGGDDTDEDLKRARTLLELFEMRGKFKQMGDTGLTKSKEKVDAVTARYAKRDLEEKEKALRTKYLNPRV